MTQVTEIRDMCWKRFEITFETNFLLLKMFQLGTQGHTGARRGTALKSIVLTIIWSMKGAIRVDSSSIWLSSIKVQAQKHQKYMKNRPWVLTQRVLENDFQPILSNLSRCAPRRPCAPLRPCVKTRFAWRAWAQGRVSPPPYHVEWKGG